MTNITMLQHRSDGIADSEEDVDEIAQLVARHRITSEHEQIAARPDVSAEEQELWRRQDPEYPPEHYRCFLKFDNRQIELYQTVGADYPDEDDEEVAADLYSDARELLLSPEFLLETAALKANSVDQSGSLEEWIRFGYCETTTPKETYDGYKLLSQRLKDLLGNNLYELVKRLSVEADADRNEESEEFE